MLKVGLTGGIAAGKSVVGEMFAAQGAHVIQADQISHQLMQPGQAVYQEVVHHFGAGILNPDGSVNRARLGELAFGGRPPGFPHPGTESDRPSRRDSPARGMDGGSRPRAILTPSPWWRRRSFSRPAWPGASIDWWS